MNVQRRFGFCILIGLAPACSGSVEILDGGADAQVFTDSGAKDAADVDAGDFFDAGPTPDATAMDTGGVDVGMPDTGPVDTGVVDTGPVDTGVADTGPVDTGVADAGPVDTGLIDTGFDSGIFDVAFPDAGGPDASTPDTGGPDAGTPDTGTPDGGAFGCDIVVAPPEVVAGQVGGSGGSVGPNLECPAGAEVIGVAVRISDQNTANGAPSAVGITLACAAVQVGSGGGSVGAETLPEVMGNGQFGWSPATQSTVTRCPVGWVVSGLTASRGPGGNLFVDATVQCSELLPSGATSGVTQAFAVMGSGSGAGVFDAVSCAAGQVVSRMTSRVGAGLDAVSVVCGTPGCAAP